MVRVMLVGLGGFLGSILRYLLSGLPHSIFPETTFPIGTVVVNLTGCLVIGFLSKLAEFQNAFSDLTRALVFTGLLGGYTTFSAYSNESLNLFRSGDYLLGAVNVLVQVIGGLAFVWAGRTVGQLAWG
jgi:CrcB protein